MKNPFTLLFLWPWIKNAFSDKDKRYSTAHILYLFEYNELIITPISTIVKNTRCIKISRIYKG